MKKLESHASNYEKNSLKDKIASAFVWAFWISLLLMMCVKCCSDMIV